VLRYGPAPWQVRFIRRGWWRCLVYKDRSNYGGMRMKAPGSEELADADDDADEVEDEKVEINFNIAKYLPDDLQTYFLRVLAEFIMQPVKQMHLLEAQQLASGTQLAPQDVEKTITAQLKEAVSTSLTRTMCRLV
jgi:hypothetical protein